MHWTTESEKYIILILFYDQNYVNLSNLKFHPLCHTKSSFFWKSPICILCWEIIRNHFFIDDFKPASVDTTQDSTVEVGEGHKITVTVPHVEVSQGQCHIDHYIMNIKCLVYLILSIDQHLAPSHWGGLWCLMPLSTMFQLSVISWWSVLLVKVTGVPEENHWPISSHWQTLSHNVVSSPPRYEQGSNSQLLWW